MKFNVQINGAFHIVMDAIRNIVSCIVIKIPKCLVVLVFNVESKATT